MFTYYALNAFNAERLQKPFRVYSVCYAFLLWDKNHRSIGRPAVFSSVLYALFWSYKMPSALSILVELMLRLK